MSASPPMTEPTAIPALAPVERPLDDDEEPLTEGLVDEDAPEVAVVVALVPELVVEGEANSEDVTLKQGMLPTKAEASTNVFGCVNTCFLSSKFEQLQEGKKTYNISTSIKALSSPTLVTRPILELNSCVGAGNDGVGGAWDAVALVAWVDFCYVVDDLGGEGRLSCWV